MRAEKESAPSHETALIGGRNFPNSVHKKERCMLLYKALPVLDCVLHVPCNSDSLCSDKAYYQACSGGESSPQGMTATKAGRQSPTHHRCRARREAAHSNPGHLLLAGSPSDLQVPPSCTLRGWAHASSKAHMSVTHERIRVRPRPRPRTLKGWYDMLWCVKLLHRRCIS